MRFLQLCQAATSLLVLIAITNVAALIPQLPAQPRPSNHNQTASEEAKHSNCRIRPFVRANDLRSGSLAEGDAFLYNNLTGVHDVEECQVRSWSLILRHRERAVLRYPVPDVVLPDEPQYNYTWDRRRSMRYSLDRDIPAVDNVSQLFDDPYEADRKEYDRKLEEYARAKRHPDHWILHDVESTLFEVETELGAVDAPVQGYQITRNIPFAVSVPPSLRIPYYDNRQSDYSWRDEQKRNFTYQHEFAFAYYANITFVNGTSVEMRAGQATFAPAPVPADEQGVTFQEQTIVIHSNATDQEVQSVTSSRFGRYADSDKDGIAAAEVAGLHATVHLSIVPPLVQGSKLRINGTIISHDRMFEVVSAGLSLEYQVQPAWALDVLRNDQRQALVDELSHGIRFQPDSSPDRGFPDGMDGGNGPSIPKTSAAWLAKFKSEHDAGTFEKNCGGGYSYSFSYPRWPAHLASVDEHGAFSAQLNVSSNAALTPHKTAFTHVGARISLQLGVRRKNATADSITEKKVSLPAHVRDALVQWPTMHSCSSDAKEVAEPTHILRRTVGPAVVLAKHWPQTMRDDALQIELEHSPCSALHTKEANKHAPMFVQATVDAARAACYDSEQQYPPLQSVDVAQVYRPSAVHAAVPFAFHKNKYSVSHECRHNGIDEGGFALGVSSGTCHDNCGQVWARKVMLPAVVKRLERLEIEQSTTTTTHTQYPLHADEDFAKEY